MILALNEICKSFGTNVVLDKITFHIEEKEKVALIGVNGAGKSTLFKIITGELSCESGSVIIPKNATIGYFSQDIGIDSSKTIYEELLSVFSSTLEKEEKMRSIEEKMALKEGEELSSLMKEYSELSRQLEKDDAYSIQSRIRGVIKGLGFSEEDGDQSVGELSGGQKTRVALGRLLLSSPDILLLDEPTNHLDIDSISWLEDYLKSYAGTVLIISHDRYFLDKTVTKVIEIERGKSKVYFGNYTHYAEKKRLDRASEMRAYENQQKEIKHQEQVIKKLREFNREKSIKRAESREKALQKTQRLDRPEAAPDKMHFTVEPMYESGNDVLRVEGVSMAYSFEPLFSDCSFEIKKGEKVALIGPNGVGKTTLIRIILGRLTPTFGSVTTGAKVKIGYYDQEQSDLHLDKTIFDEISDTYPDLTATKIRNVLAAFVFKGDDVFKTISSLSGGEKGRVALAKIMLSNANFLILDEPTNHLDLESKEILEGVLNNYTGTVLYISHDRYFINSTAKRIIELKKDGINNYLGNYDYYCEKVRSAEYENESAEIVSETKEDWKKQKEKQAAIRKTENELKKVEIEIGDLEDSIKELTDLLATEDVYTDAAKAKEIYEQKEKQEEDLMELYGRYEELSTLLEDKVM